jgi:hypothetical protein
MRGDIETEVDGIITKLGDMVDAFGQALPNPFIDVNGWASDAAGDIQTVIDKLDDVWDACNANLPNPFSDLSGWAFDAAGDVQTVIDAVNACWDTCNGGMPNPFGDFSGWADDAVDAIWRVIDALRELAGAQSAAGNPGYATGTLFAPGGFAMVGEAGPEMMFLPRGSRIMSGGELAGRGGGAGVTNNTTNRSGDTIIIQDQASMALLLNELRRGRMGRLAERF